MYNGIGLQTARGSGTNGHVQRNWAIIRKTKDKGDYKVEEKLDQINKPPNQEILDHVRKRKVEVKCAEFADILEDQGLTPDEVKMKVTAYRESLLGNDAILSEPTDKFGQTNLRETHHVAEAQQEKNAKLREAFGISEFFVEGSSLDPERHAREAEARAAANQIHELIPSSPSTDPVAIATDVITARKLAQKKSASGSKKKKGKKHKKDRSESPRIIKKDKSKKRKKEKEKKRKKIETSSSESNSSDESDTSRFYEIESKKKKKKKKSKTDNEKDKHDKKKAFMKRKRHSSGSTSNSFLGRLKKNAKEVKLPSEEISIDPTSHESHQTHLHNSRQVQSYVRTPSPSKSNEAPARDMRIETKKKPMDEELITQHTIASYVSLKRNKQRSISVSRDARGRSPKRYSTSVSPQRVLLSKSLKSVRKYSKSRSRSQSRYGPLRRRSKRRYSPLRQRRSQSRRRSPGFPNDYRERSRNRGIGCSGTRTCSRQLSLSCSPARKSFNRHENLLGNNTQCRKSEVKKQKSRSVSKSRKSTIIPPRVGLQSSSEDETEIVYDDVKQQIDEIHQNDMNILKHLQNDLAAKARETLGKKKIDLVKMRTLEKEENVSDIALPAPSLETIIINQSTTLQKKSMQSLHLNPLKSIDSSRSPSPALPLTREEAMYSSSSVMSPITTSLEQYIVQSNSPIELPLSPKQINTTLSRSPSPAVKKQKCYPRSTSRSYSRSVSIEIKGLESPKNQPSRYKKLKSHEQNKKSMSQKRLSKSLSRTKESVRSKHSRCSRSSSRSNCSISRSRSRSKSIVPHSPKKLQSRRSSRSSSRGRSPFKKACHHLRSVSKISRGKRKKTWSSSDSLRSFSSSSRSSTTESSRSSRSTSSTSESSRSRSPSIPRRYGSPSFLDRRRITSARKRPIPYHRPTPSPLSSPSSSESSRKSDWSSTTRQSSHSLTRSPSYNG